MTPLRRLIRNDGGASAAEFAMVVPLLLIFLFFIIDGARYLYNVNRIEKAAQFGARYAAVTAPVAGEITGYNFAGTGSPVLIQGDVIPAGAMATVTCSSTACSCATGGSGVCLAGTYNATAFTNIFTRTKNLLPALTAANVTVSYSGSGLGYAGDPSGADVAPLVTVQISGLSWNPLSLLMLKGAGYPVIASTLTAEDLVGTHSN